MIVNKCNKINPVLYIILGINFLLSILLGIYSGGGHSDASNYITLAIQIVNQNDWGQLLLTNDGREIFSIWLCFLCIFMTVFGASNMSAILLTSIFGTSGIYAFYRLVRLFWDRKSSYFLTTILAITPVYLVISHNALYDALFIFIFFTALFYYFRFFENYKRKEIIISGFLMSLLAFVHAAGYPYIFFLWVVFIAFDKSTDRWKNWIIFSFFAGVLPVVQMLIWKFVIYDSFYPYQTLAYDWSTSNDLFEAVVLLKHKLRFVLTLILGYTPVLFLTLFIYLFDIPWKSKKMIVLGCGIFLLTIIGLLLYGIHIDSLYPLIIVFILIYTITLKRELIEQNGLVFFFGLMSVFTFSIYVRFFPKPYFHQKHFIYPVIFLIPIYWYYAKKFIRNDFKIFLILIIAMGLQSMVSLYFQLPQNIDKRPSGFNVKYSSTFKFSLPYTNEGIQKDIAKWYKNKGIQVNAYIITNRHERYVNAQLNMAQNHYIKIIDSYSIINGFEKPSLTKTINVINKYQPAFIHWDKDKNNSLYQKIDINGKRKFLFSYEELLNSLPDNYTLADSIDNKIIFFQNIR